MLTKEWNQIPDQQLLITIGSIARARLYGTQDKILLNVYQQILAQTVEGLKHEGLRQSPVSESMGPDNQSPVL